MGKAKTMPQLTPRITFKGTGAVAKALGCSWTHVSAIISGERKSTRLRAKAKKLGIQIPSIDDFEIVHHAKEAAK